MKITLETLQTIADNEMGLQKEGYWYEDYAQMWEHAVHICTQAMSIANPGFHSFVTLVYNTIMNSPCRGSFNAPPFVEELIARAKDREEAALAAWTDEQEARYEYERVMGR